MPAKLFAIVLALPLILSANVTCPEMGCAMFCESGFVKDAKGCDTCVCAPSCPCGTECKTTAGAAGKCSLKGECIAATSSVRIVCQTPCSDMMCAIACAYGFVKDANGCEVCQCAPEPPSPCRCGSECKMTTGGVGVCQENGECAVNIMAPACKPVCSNLLCGMACPNGYSKDASGCNMCQCAPEPCKCGDACKTADGTAGVCQENGECSAMITANAVPACKPVCSGLLCRMYCRYGNMIDENGCSLCACNPAPPCPCGQACKTEAGTEGRCSKDETTCVDIRTADMLPVDQVCGVKCPDLACMMYCPYGSAMDSNGCSTCSCNPDPNCPCGAPCTSQKNVTGVCTRDGSCVDAAVATTLPCVECAPMTCKLLCPYGNAVDKNGCPQCECNPPPPCKCGDGCKTIAGVEGVCQVDGTCSIETNKMPDCRPVCSEMMCMMYCEHGNVMDATTGCATCKCNPAPPERCVCGKPCFTAQGNGTCQADGVCAAGLRVAPMCDKPMCPAVLCALYCPNGNARDENGCPACRCNPESPVPVLPTSDCKKCGEKCAAGVCSKDLKCMPLPADAAVHFGVVCEQTSCPSLACNLFCPHGNAVDAYGCATCACLPRPVRCTCGSSCKSEDGQRGVCQEDGKTCAVNIMQPKCRKPKCPAVRCMSFCANGNVIGPNGCPTCRCKPDVKPLACPCGASCELKDNMKGQCQADGTCGESRALCEKSVCGAALCMVFCPFGNVIDANGCSTCKCLQPPTECPCGRMCKTATGVAGLCQADGKTCSESANGAVCSKEVVPECPLMKCQKWCPTGYVIEKGCPTCGCLPEPDPATKCTCGQSCELKDAKGFCQPDGGCIATAPACPKIECPQQACLMFCPNGNAVDANGCPICKCNPTCPCGQACKTEQGEIGTCQKDESLCLANVAAPECPMMTEAATSCRAVECPNFCDSGSKLDVNGCDTCECESPCPCGQSCRMAEDAGFGICQNDGVTCVAAAAAVDCKQAAAQPLPGSSSKGVIVACVVIGLVIALTVALLMYRRRQTKRVGAEQTYTDVDPAGYVAPAVSSRV